MGYEQCRLGMVAGPHPRTAEAGLEVLQEGGNAFDAAVAAAFTEAVVQPGHNGVAGYGGAAVCFHAGSRQVVCVDYNTEAPAAARPDMFLTEPHPTNVFSVVEALQKRGALSIGIPGTVAGLDEIHRSWGALPVERLLAPAIRAARDGWRCNRATHRNLLEDLPAIRAFTETARILMPDGNPPQPGDQMRNPELAETLEYLARRGLRDFYEGELAERIIEGLQREGGILTRADLAGYRARQVEALAHDYRGHTLHTPPVGCGGITSFQILEVLDAFDFPPAPEVGFYHLFVEVLKACWQRRVTEVGEGVPEAGQMAPELLADLRREVAVHRESASERPRIAPDPFFCTSHICTADARGNVVSLTQTHGAFCGSWVTLPGTGLLFGHGMARFEPRPGWPNSIAPGKRPLHNMAPMLVLREGRPVYAYGTPGGRTIVNNQAFFALGLLRWGLGLYATVSLPRAHMEEAGPLKLEKRASDEVAADLIARGHPVERVDFNGGPVSVIKIGPDREMAGATDPRFEGRVCWE